MTVGRRTRKYVAAPDSFYRPMTGWSRSDSGVRDQCGCWSVLLALGGSGGFRIAVPLPACPPLVGLVLMQLLAHRHRLSARRRRRDFRGGREMQCDARAVCGFATTHRGAKAKPALETHCASQPIHIGSAKASGSTGHCQFVKSGFKSEGNEPAISLHQYTGKLWLTRTQRRRGRR
jgi:hypothetical protein